MGAAAAIGAALATLSAAANEFWEHDVAAAIEIARAERRWALLYFPPAEGGDPQEVERFAPDRSRAGLLVGARVRASEVRDLIERHGIGELPALVLLDPFGERAERWEGRWRMREVLATVGALERQLVKLIEELDRRVALAARALEEERHAVAIEHCREVIGRTHRGFPQRSRVAAILGRVFRRAEDELVAILALEGVISDRKLLAELAALEARFPGLPLLDARLQRERERLKTRRIGG